MNWAREQWRKLYIRRVGEWNSLPSSARGLADEMIVYCDDEGRLAPVHPRATIEEKGLAVARAVCAHPEELERITRDVTLLERVCYCVTRDAYVCVRNFVEAQQNRSAGAKRQKAYRDRKRELKDAERDVTRDRNANIDVMQNRIEENRDLNTLTRARDAWAQRVGLFADPQGLLEVAGLCEEGARAAGIEAGEYCDRAIAAFAEWIDGIEPASRRPQKAPAAFVRNFGRIQEIVVGKRAAKPSTQSAENELMSGPIAARARTREVKL